MSTTPIQKKVTAVKARKADATPSRLKTCKNQGIYVSSARVKRWLDTLGINYDIYEATTELRNAEPHEETRDGVKVMTTLIPLVNLSKKTQELVEEARNLTDSRNKLNLDKREKKIAAGTLDLAAEQATALVKVQEQEAKNAERLALGEAIRAPKPETPHGVSIDNLSKMRIRFAKDTPTNVAAVICAFLHDITAFGMYNVLEQGQKILKVRHILADGIHNRLFSTLYENLPVFKNAVRAEASRRDLEKLKAEEKKKVRKAAGASKTCTGLSKEESVGVKLATPTKKITAVVHEVKDDEDDQPDNERDFKHYVRAVCHNTMNRKVDDEKKAEYDRVRISNEVREFGSDLVINFIQTLGPLISGQIDLMNVKTVNSTIIRSIITMLFEYTNGDPVGVNKVFDAKIEVHNTFLSKKRDEKEAAAIVKKAADVAVQ